MLKLRDLSECFGLVEQIQMLEKEKLILTAAIHLDQIRSKFPFITESQLGSLVNDNDEKMRCNIALLDTQIIELMEQIQIAKCEML